jgi:hypothetical protein
MTADDATAKTYEREVAHARQVIHTAKLVVTFSAAIAATFVASAMQTDHPDCWDIVAAVFMALTFIVTAAVLVFRPKPHAGEMDSRVFESATNRAELAHWLTVTQVGFAVLASMASAVGLLISERP